MTGDEAKPERRSIRFDSMEAILEDAETLAGGSIRATGNCTPSQIFQHVARAIHNSIDGYDVLGPERERKIAARRDRDQLLSQGLPPGIKLEGEMARYAPTEDVTLGEAMAYLRAGVERTRNERMEAVHPFLDTMDHEQWIQFHCRHAELHFSFLFPGMEN
ncbi:MAG: DUF1569 domain-containing protein [Planctomycetota bacterium]|nr:DUF1569 domain-containing protein [Planctomycetota bacterium]